MKVYLVTILALIIPSFSALSQSFVQGEFTGFSIGEPQIMDINNDSKVDVIGLEKFGFGSVGDLVIYLNKSQIDSIDFEIVELDTRGIGAPSVADMDGDNDLDIIVSEWDGSKAMVVILYNDGNLTFTKDTVSIENVYRHKVADLDGDNDLDVVSTNRDKDYMVVHINDGNGEFIVSQILERNDLHSTGLHDFDNDGDIDIVIGFDDFFDSNFILWANNGSGEFLENSISTSPYGNLSNFKMTDVDENGLHDIVFFGSNSKSLRVILQTTNGIYEEQELLNSPNVISGFTISNFDSKNSNDILLGGDNQTDITFHLNQETGPFDFEDFEIVSGISPASFLEASDLDGDGDLDVVVSNGDFWWLENRLSQGSVNVLQNSINDLKLYPNPFSHSVYIEGMKAGQMLELFDINGNRILKIDAPIKKLDLQDVPKGIYLFRIVDNMGLEHSVYPLVKE